MVARTELSWWSAPTYRRGGFYESLDSVRGNDLSRSRSLVTAGPDAAKSTFMVIGC
ncbi:MAG: hypothetical protein U5R31_14680 [Acidimicrobiia bacterium]|nr:hypothetical protein [Acidimicrobiia bacterium]